MPKPDPVIIAPPGPVPPVTVRPARPSDARAAWAIEHAAFTEFDRFSPRRIAGLITNPRARAFVADSDGAVLGWIAALVRRGVHGPSGRIYTVAVSPDEAGRGIGRLLTAHTLGVLDAGGVERVCLEVRQENRRAIALYESLGFRVVRELPDYYADGAPGLRMARRRGAAPTPVSP